MDVHEVFDEFKRQLPDVDPDETQEWIDSLDALVEQAGPERARFVLYKLLKRARMLQARRKGFCLQALRDGRRLVLLPADDARDVHRRQQILLNLRQLWIGADLRIGITAAVIATGKT